MLDHMPNCFGGGDGIFDFSICFLVQTIVVYFLTSLIVGRFLLPSAKRMHRNEVYLQIASFVSASADLVELTNYMQEEHVSSSFTVMKVAQGVFGLSLVQFSFSLAAVKRRNEYLTRGWPRMLDIIFATESWSLILIIFTQELPCFVFRIFLVEDVLRGIDLTLSFFIVKNGLMILLFSYRIVVVCWRQFQVEKLDANQEIRI